MSLLFNMLSRLLIPFLPRSKHLLNSWLKSPSTVILEFKKIKVSHRFHCFPIHLPWRDGMGCQFLVFRKLSFKPTFSLCFTFIKRLFSSSSLSAIRVVSSAYLRLLIFLPAILISAYASSSSAFLMMYSAYKLNSRVTIYSLDVLLSRFGTSLLFHVQINFGKIDLFTVLRKKIGLFIYSITFLCPSRKYYSFKNI